jgi:type II secretory pathway predicted ATPase ExeA
MDSKTPFATVLIGQPTLRRMIKLGVLAANASRSATR